MNLKQECRRTHPDYIVFAPASTDRSTAATGNEHFLVERLPDGTLFAVWTQSSHEGATDQHIVVSKSHDGGKTWRSPRTVAGPRPGKNPPGMASWAFPLFSKKGRVYLLYSRHVGINDIFSHTTGLMACIFSDDGGETWSEETLLPMSRSIWDNPDPSVPANWIVWQKPLRLDHGAGPYFAGFTRWVSPSRIKAPEETWTSVPSVVEFMRFENIDENPAPADIRISWFAADKAALQVPYLTKGDPAVPGSRKTMPGVPVIQEPSWVELPDGRLFCVMRTTQGSPYWSTSADRGETWSQPRPLKTRDDGRVLPHPLSPCPLYAVADGTYVLLYHNHDGHFLNWGPANTDQHRRPICLARGDFHPEAEQPVWFSEPWYFMDHGGVPILRPDLAMYASVTPSPDGDGVILWYPDRKFFLLGKHVRASELAALPKSTA